LTTSSVVFEVVRIWLVGWQVPFSVILGLVSVYIWVVPWYLDDPDCLIVIKRQTKWGNRLSVLVNAVLGYLLWWVMPFIFTVMAIRACLVSRRLGISFREAFAAIFHDRERELTTASVQGGEPT